MLKINQGAYSIPFKIAMSFLSVILIGSLLLSLPISQTAESQASYFDHLFTAVSMVCVTGLYTQAVALTYNTFGQIICMILIKLGGLGLLTLVAAVYIRMKHRYNIKNSVLISEALNRFDLSDFKDFVFMIFKLTTLTDLIGTFLLSFVFVPLHGFGKGIFTALFISISAFNNAGFDNFGTISLQDFKVHPIISIVVPLLIIAGGLGFSVWFELIEWLKNLIMSKSSGFWISLKQLSLHTRLVLSATIFFLLFGTVLFLLTEWTNPLTLGGLNLFDKLQVSFFQSATMRTAGFATIDYTHIRLASFLIFFALMFVGGSPGSTAGGAKTTTVMLVLLMIKNEIAQKEHITYRHHTISRSLVSKALIICILFGLIIGSSSFVISILESGIEFEYIVFEVVSALATVGVSANLTPHLTPISQTILMLLMFIGRIGPITFFAALQIKQKPVNEVQYAKGQVLIG